MRTIYCSACDRESPEEDWEVSDVGRECPRCGNDEVDPVIRESADEDSDGGESD